MTLVPVEVGKSIKNVTVNKYTNIITNMKNWFKKNPKSLMIIGLFVLIGIGAIVYYAFFWNINPKVTDFKSCSESTKGVIREIYPAQCVYNGVTYTEEVAIDLDETNPNGEGINLDLPENEKTQIEAWLEKNDYNQYGDKTDTLYPGGTPLFDEAKGTYIKLYDYLLKKYPSKPWLTTTAKPITDSSNTNPEVKSFTTVKNWLNFTDPNFELQYPDFVELANQNGYPVKFTGEDGFEFVIYVDTKAPQYDAGTCEKKADVDTLGVYLCYNKTKAYQELYQRMLDSFVAR
jgi:hypothetical protein